MADFFRGDQPNNEYDMNLLQRIPKNTITELTNAMRFMAKGKCRDKTGICLEMILQGGATLHGCLVTIYNRMLQSGEMDDNWRTHDANIDF